MDCFRSSDGKILLSLTGSGVYSAIFSVSSVLAARPPEKRDLCLFYGSAARVSSARVSPAGDAPTAGESPVSEDDREKGQALYRAAFVRDLISGRSWYPDLMWDTGVPDAAVITGKEIYRGGDAGVPDAAVISGKEIYRREDAGRGAEESRAPAGAGADAGENARVMRDMDAGTRLPVLYDLESAGFCDAAFRHFGPHQIMVFRFVSDEGETITRRQLEVAAEKSAGQMERLIRRLLRDESRKCPDGAAAEDAGCTPASEKTGAELTGKNSRNTDTAENTEAADTAENTEAADTAENTEAADTAENTEAADTAENTETAGTAEERLASRLHASVSMKSELHRYVRYADLAGIPWQEKAEKIMEEPCPDRRNGKVRLRSLEKAILDLRRDEGSAEDTGLIGAGSGHGTGIAAGMRLRPAFSCIYVEEDVMDHPGTRRLLDRFTRAAVIPVRHYQDVFDRKRQDYALQHRSPALILARNTGELIHRGSPVCQSFDERYFYYCSSVMNCPYDCEYCWLKGMYESGNRVIFVNIEDTFAAVEKLLSSHPVYLCVSYDSELLAADELTGYAGMWSDFAAEHPGLTIEIRTKGVPALPRMTVSGRTILAFTLNPERICARFERQAPSLNHRIRLVREAMDKGFPVRLCFDPVIVCPGWKEDYRELMAQLDAAVDWSKIRDVSVGTFRLSADYMKRMRRRYPDSELLQFPYDCTEGFYHLPDETEKEAEAFVSGLVGERCGKEKIFLWR